jgi:transcriptional regulator with XRE-family HTH domain
VLVLRVERQRRNWPLRKLSKQTGIAPTDLSRIERGLLAPWPGWRRRLAAAFGLPEGFLFAHVVEGAVAEQAGRVA